MENPDQAPEAVAEEPVADVTETPAVESEAPAEPVVEEVAAEEPAVDPPVIEEEAPVVEAAPEVVAEDAPAETEAVAEEPTPEHVVDGLIDGDTLVPMVHPDGGGCDAYETDDAGALLVPATDVAVMVSHGFAPVGDGE